MHASGMPVAIPGQYIVGFKPGTTEHQQQDALRSLAPKRLEPLSFVNGALVQFDTKGGQDARGIPTLGPEAKKYVEWMQPNYRLQLRRPAGEPTESWGRAKAAGETPVNDPEFPKQYALRNTGQTGGTPGADVKAPQAWSSSTGKGVIVALADTNIDIDHPDLAANVWTNTGEVAGNNLDDDGNGYVDDVHGWNFGRNSNRPQDGGQSHGTHVAGIVGAIANNGVGVSGTAPGVQLMPIPILTGGGSTANAVKAFAYAVQNGANIISNSWGNNTYEPALQAAVTQATKAGAMVVVAAGNENWDTGVNGSYPDNYAGSTSIAASDHGDAKARYSNRGTLTIDVAAPGDAILSTVPGGKYQHLSGTSMAAPVYAGVAALVKSKCPDLTMPQVEERIFRSVQRTGSAAAWNRLVASGGRIDAEAALTPIATPTAPVARGAQAGAPVRVGWGADIIEGQSFEVQASLNANATSAVVEDFEQAPTRSFTTAGDVKWAIGEGLAKNGTKAFSVGGLGNNQQSRLELTEVLPQETEVSFWYKPSRGGELSFFVNRDLQFQPAPAGSTDEWQQFRTTLPAGEYNFAWLAAGRGSTVAGPMAIDGLQIGAVSDAIWSPVARTKAGETAVDWTPPHASGAAQVRVRADNGRFTGGWVVGPEFKVPAAQQADGAQGQSSV